MNTLIYILACIGGLFVLSAILFLLIGAVNTWNYWRYTRKESKDDR